MIGVGGPPGSGKSRLVAALLPLLGPGTPFREPCVVAGLPTGLVGTLHPGSVRVLGVYDAAPYPGTDRVCKRVPAAFPAILARWAAAGPEGAVLFEGQRLFSARLVAAALAVAPASRFYFLDAPGPVLAARRAARGDRKGAAFLRGAATQARNALAAAGGSGIVLPNAAPADLGRNVARIAADLGL